MRRGKLPTILTVLVLAYVVAVVLLVLWIGASTLGSTILEKSPANALRGEAALSATSGEVVGIESEEDSTILEVKTEDELGGD